MTTSLEQMLNQMYGTDDAGSMQKTAEDNLLSTLRGEDADLESYSTEELQKIAETLEASDPDMDKVATEMLGGEIMAHALVHEMGLIKEAMMQGLCRVCKTSAMDVVGSSVCSECSGE